MALIHRLAVAPAGASPRSEAGAKATAEPSLSALEADLAEKGIEPAAALQEFSAYLEHEFATNTELNEQQKEEVAGTIDRLSSCRNQWSGTSGSAARTTLTPTTHSSERWGQQVGPLIAYFWENGYFFAAGLLTHASEKKPNEIYYPMFHARVRKSPVFQRIQSGEIGVEDGAAFAPADDHVGQDLFYAVDHFEHMKESAQIFSIWDAS